MAVLGFSHITCEVADFGAALRFWQEAGFVEQFTLNMPILECKKPVLAGNPKKVRLSYLTYHGDELCNIELICHDDAPKTQAVQKDRLVPVFYSRQVKEDCVIKDPEGNEIRLFHFSGNSQRHYIIPSWCVAETADFYKQYFHLVQGETPPGLGLPTGALSLGLPRFLHPNWQGQLHIVPGGAKGQQRKLNHMGFQSFCFLVSDAAKDIYGRFKQEEVHGPIAETKMVKGEPVTFEVGFFYDPTGFPVEYLQISPRKG